MYLKILLTTKGRLAGPSKITTYCFQSNVMCVGHFCSMLPILFSDCTVDKYFGTSKYLRLYQNAAARAPR